MIELIKKIQNYQDRIDGCNYKGIEIITNKQNIKFLINSEIQCCEYYSIDLFILDNYCSNKLIIDLDLDSSLNSLGNRGVFRYELINCIDNEDSNNKLNKLNKLLKNYIITDIKWDNKYIKNNVEHGDEGIRSANILLNVTNYNYIIKELLYNNNIKCNIYKFLDNINKIIISIWNEHNGYYPHQYYVKWNNYEDIDII